MFYALHLTIITPVIHIIVFFLLIFLLIFPISPINITIN